MRLGAVWVPNSAAHYRAVEPLRAMERRGHQVVWPPDAEGKPEPRQLAGCDVVHVYRRAEDPARQVLEQLAVRGVRITYDNDDDFTVMPKESPSYLKLGGLKGQR